MKSTETLLSSSEAQTKKIAQAFAKKLTFPAVICLYGNLGSGKTTFTKGLGTAFGIFEREIKSPTYTFVREYRLPQLHFYHFDCYRLQPKDTMMEQEVREILQKQNVCVVIEWPQSIESLLPFNAHIIRFEAVDDQTRQLTFEFSE